MPKTIREKAVANPEEQKAGREHSKQIKARFIQAVSALAKEQYPELKEIDIIRSVGMLAVNYYKMRVDEGRYPTLDNCALLCLKHGISGSWLLCNKGSMKEINGRKMEAVEMLKIATKEIEMNLKVKK
jgi:hypothetical protein